MTQLMTRLKVARGNDATRLWNPIGSIRVNATKSGLEVRLKVMAVKTEKKSTTAKTKRPMVTLSWNPSLKNTAMLRVLASRPMAETRQFKYSTLMAMNSKEMSRPIRGTYGIWMSGVDIVMFCVAAIIVWCVTFISINVSTNSFITWICSISQTTFKKETHQQWSVFIC